MEVFGWKKKKITPDDEATIEELLNQGEKELSCIWQQQKTAQPTLANPYETPLMV